MGSVPFAHESQYQLHINMTRGNSGANRGNRGRGRNDRGNSSGRHNRGPGQASVSAEGSTRLLATVGSAHITMPTGASREEGVKEEIDQKLGFVEFSKGPAREGWMVNMHPVSPSATPRSTR